MSLQTYAAGAWRDPENEGPAGGLADRRRVDMDRVLGALAAKGRRPKIVAYAAVERGEDPAPDLGACRKYAEFHGWEITGWHFDDCGRTTALEDRAGWKKIRAAVGGGFAHGIVAVNRAAVALEMEPYDAVLDWLDVNGAFLGLVLSGGPEADA